MAVSFLAHDALRVLLVSMRAAALALEQHVRCGERRASAMAARITFWSGYYALAMFRAQLAALEPAQRPECRD